MPSLHSILESSLQHLSPYLEKNNLEAYRLYNNTHREFPIAIDIYKDNAVIHIFDIIPFELAQELEEELQTLLGIRDFFYKNRTRQDVSIPKSSARKEITVQEYGNFFSINLSDYLDTGLFLDHRETRKWIASQGQNKIILNTFAYTGSFTIYAAKAGATKTYSVDLSKTYCEWIKENLSINNLEPEKNWVYKMDTLEFFRYAKKKL
ncbi:MAG: class I SAM-dependent methyltransferase, partial [Candidatus Gracilibacteria bacterium]